MKIIVYDIIQPSKRTTIGDNYNQINTGQDLNLNIWVIFNPRYSLLKIEDLKTVSHNFEASKHVLMGAPVCYWNSRVCLVSRHYLASLIPNWQTRSDNQACLFYTTYMSKRRKLSHCCIIKSHTYIQYRPIVVVRVQVKLPGQSNNKKCICLHYGIGGITLAWV